MHTQQMHEISSYMFRSYMGAIIRDAFETVCCMQHSHTFRWLQLDVFNKVQKNIKV